MVPECSCELWKLNIERINAPIILQQIRAGTSFQCDQFVFCPWCGKSLTGKPTGNNTPTHDPKTVQLLRDWIKACPNPPGWHWSFDLHARTVNLLGNTPETRGTSEEMPL